MIVFLFSFPIFEMIKVGLLVADSWKICYNTEKDFWNIKSFTYE